MEAPCKQALRRPLAHLAQRGATIVILGCTGLPLIIDQQPAWRTGARTVALIDPTDILARRCVAIARGAV